MRGPSGRRIRLLRSQMRCEIRLLTSVTARCYDKVSKECLTCDCLSVRPSICPICLSVCLSACLSLCLSRLSLSCLCWPLSLPHRTFLMLLWMLLCALLSYSRFLRFSIECLTYIQMHTHTYVYICVCMCFFYILATTCG